MFVCIVCLYGCVVCVTCICPTVKDKEEGQLDSEARPMKDEAFGEYRCVPEPSPLSWSVFYNLPLCPDVCSRPLLCVLKCQFSRTFYFYIQTEPHFKIINDWTELLISL